jgi:hypothetical protein
MVEAFGGCLRNDGTCADAGTNRQVTAIHPITKR